MHAYRSNGYFHPRKWLDSRCEIAQRGQNMELLIIVIAGVIGGYVLARVFYRDGLKDLSYRLETAEWERQKQFWAHKYTARRLGVDVESEEWYRALQEEEAEYEKQHPHRWKNKHHSG